MRTVCHAGNHYAVIIQFESPRITRITRITRKKAGRPEVFSSAGPSPFRERNSGRFSGSGTVSSAFIRVIRGLFHCIVTAYAFPIVRDQRRSARISPGQRFQRFFEIVARTRRLGAINHQTYALPVHKPGSAGIPAGTPPSVALADRDVGAPMPPIQWFNARSCRCGNSLPKL